MPGGYSSQLEEIVRALNRPSTPTWLVAMVSALLGFLASVLGQMFQHWYSERRAHAKMRMIIYSELGSMYSHLVHFHNVKTHLPQEQDVQWRKKQLKERFLKFEGEKYAEENKDIFIQLKERSTISELYGAIRDVFAPEEEYGFFINSGLAIEIMEDCVRLNYLPNTWVKRYMNSTDVAAIAEANRKRVAKGQATC